MGYYYIELSPGSKQLCTILLLWGNYEYQKLTMGVCNRPDIFLENISELFKGSNIVRAYIDNVLVVTKNDFTDHITAPWKLL